MSTTKTGDKVRKASGCAITAGVMVTAGQTADRWVTMIKRLRASSDKALRLTNLQAEVAFATLTMVVRERWQPSREQIAARVRRKMGCSERTVERAHIRLNELGLLRWEAEYLIGKRQDREVGPVQQARRQSNPYEFVLPGSPIPVPPPNLRPKPSRFHSCDRQDGGVTLREAKLPSLSCLESRVSMPTAAELSARFARKRAEEQAAKRAKGLWTV